MALAPTIYNPGKRGQDARYDISGLPLVERNGRNVYFDGTYEYDSNGLDLSGRPPEWVPGLPGSDESGGNEMGSGSLLARDPLYQQMLQDLRAGSISDKASRDAGIKRSFINFGLGNFDLGKAAATTGVGELGSILDQQTMGLAANNQFSVQKRLERALADRIQQNRVALRQRGGSRSGEAGFLAQRAQTDFDTDLFDSTQKLLDYISGAQAAFAAAEQARKRQEFELALMAARDAAGRGGGGGGGEPEPPALSQPTAQTDWSQVVATPQTASYLSTPARAPWAPSEYVPQRRSGV